MSYFVFVVVIFHRADGCRPCLCCVAGPPERIVYRTPGYPVTPIIFLLLIALLLFLLGGHNPEEALLGRRRRRAGFAGLLPAVSPANTVRLWVRLEASTARRFNVETASSARL